MYRKDAFAIDAVIGMVKSTNHRFRVVTIFRRLGQVVEDAPNKSKRGSHEVSAEGYQLMLLPGHGSK